MFTAVVKARSEGPWSDDFQVSAALETAPLKITQVDGLSGQYTLTFAGSPPPMDTGSLIRLRWAQPGVDLFVVATEWLGGNQVQGPGCRIERVDTAKESWVVKASELWRADVPGPSAREARKDQTWDGSWQNGQLSLDVSQGAPRVGALLQVTPQASGSAPYVVAVVDVPPGPSLQSNPITVRGGYRPVAPGAPPTGPFSAHLLALEVSARDGDRLWRLGNLGFHSSHRRFLGAVPDDEALFGPRDRSCGESQRPKQGSLEQDAAGPRFPLAAGGAQDEIYLPLGVDSAIDPPTVSAPLDDPGPGTAMLRGGLEGFDPRLFFDRDLKDSTAVTLEGAAFAKRFLSGQRLRGVHSLFYSQEPTLISVPDAAHAGWDAVAATAELVAPYLAVEQTAGQKGTALSWGSVALATGYLLEESQDPEFLTAVVRTTLSETGDEASGGYCPWTPCRSRCAVRLYYRVRALGAGTSQISPWSNTCIVDVPPPTFRMAAAAPREAPDIQGNTPETGRYDVSWTLANQPVGTLFGLQEADEPYSWIPYSINPNQNPCFIYGQPIAFIDAADSRR